MKEELERKNQFIITKSSEIEKLRENNVRWESDIAHLKDLLEENTAAIDEKNKIIVEQKKKIEEISNLKEASRGELNRVREELEEREAALGSQGSEMEGLKEGAENLRSEIKNLKEILTDKEELSKSMELELDIVRQSVEEAMKDKSQEYSIEEINALKEANMGELNRVREELEDLLNDKEKTITIQNEKLNQLSNLKEANMGELNRVREELEEREAALGSQGSEMEGLKEGAENLRSEIKNLKEILTDKEELSKSMELELDSTRKSFKTDSARLLGRVKELETEIGTKLEEKDKFIDGLMSELKTLDDAMAKDVKERELFEKKFAPLITGALNKKLMRLDTEKKAAQSLSDQINRRKDIDERIKAGRKMKVEELAKKLKELKDSKESKASDE